MNCADGVRDDYERRVRQCSNEAVVVYNALSLCQDCYEKRLQNDFDALLKIEEWQRKFRWWNPRTWF